MGEQPGEERGKYKIGGMVGNKKQGRKMNQEGGGILTDREGNEV